MDAMQKIKIDPREVDTEWLKRYHAIVVGLANLAKCHAEACETEWMAMENSLQALADLLKEDIDGRTNEK